MKFLRVEVHEKSRTDRRDECVNIQEIEYIENIEGIVSLPHKTAIISKSGRTYYCTLDFDTLLRYLKDNFFDVKEEHQHLIF